jgi:hypothetical protein
MARSTTYDQLTVKELRMEVINACLDVMQDKNTDNWPKYKKELVLKMAPRVLPQLNAGKDDDKDLIPQPILGGLSTPPSSQE